MAMERPGPYHSKLRKYVDLIKAWRRDDKTWKQVTEELAKLGCKTDPPSVCRFIKRYETRPYAIGAAPEKPQPQTAIVRQPEVKATQPESKTFKDGFARRAEAPQRNKLKENIRPDEAAWPEEKDEH